MSVKSPSSGKTKSKAVPKTKPEEPKASEPTPRSVPVVEQETSEPTISMDQYMDEVRQRAHEIYLERGDKPGTSLGDWLQAEREIKERYNIKQ